MKKSNVCTTESVDTRLSAKTKFSKLLKPSLVALAVAQSFSLTSTQAATIYVGGANGAGCGLSAAILSANNDVSHPGSACVAGSGDDVIELNRDVVISKSWKDDDNGVKIDTYTAMPLITSNLTIDGNGNTLSRDATAPEFRLLKAEGAISLTLNDLTIEGGNLSSANYYEGSAIEIKSDLSLNNVSIINNQGFNAIIATGDTTINNSAITNNAGANTINVSGATTNISNSTISHNTGRGISQKYSGYLSIDNSTISYNSSDGVGSYRNFTGSLYIKDSQINDNGGNGLYVIAEYFNEVDSVNIQNSFFDRNGAAGARVIHSKDVEINNSVFRYNTNGGLALNVEDATIINSDISNNTTDRNCAGISVGPIAKFYLSRDANVLVSGSTVSNNTAAGRGGGICNRSDIPRYYVAKSNISITDSAITGNVSGEEGGGISSGGPTKGSYIDPNTKNIVTISNSTVSGNTSGTSGGGISLTESVYYQNGGGFGGEAFRGARLILENTTVVNNTASSSGGGISTNGAYVNMSNSIVAGNDATVSGSEIFTNATPNFTGDEALETQNNILGSSLISNFQAFTDFIPSGTDITATIDGTSPTMFDSIVDPLQDNGGATQTHALPLGSPAIDAGDLDTCLNDPVNGLDQRDEVRGDLGLCDIGAYETQTMTGQLPSISIDSVEVSEGDSTATLTISLSSPQTEPIPVDFQTVDGTATEGLDYTGRIGTMTFAPGQTQKIRVIQINDDDLSEPIETFSLLLSNPVGASLSEPVGELTIIDDDGLPTISIEPADHSVNEGDSGNSRRVSYTITLSSQQADRVSIDYQTMDETAIGGVDYEARSGTMTFAPGQTSKIRVIKVLGDTQPELDETFKLVLSNPSSNAALDVDEADTIGTIVDDDGLPTISIEPADHSVNEGDSGNSRRVSYTIKLSSAQTEKVSVDYQTMDETAVGGVDYEIRSGRMTFMPGQTSKIRTVKVLGDTQVEADETFKLVFSNPSSNAALDIDEANSIGTILDDD